MQARTKGVKYVVMYIKENSNPMNIERLSYKLSHKNILKTAYLDITNR